MARRSDHTKEELKELAIRAGSELIEKEGISNFSARQVATSIGYAVGTIYHVFGTLDAFMIHIHAKTLDHWYDKLTKDLQRQKGDRLRFLALAYLDFARENYNLWSALFEYRVKPETEIPQWYKEKLAKLFGLIEEALMPHMNNNRKKAKTSARILWASIHGICTLSLSGKLDIVEAEKPEVMMKLLIENYLND